MQVLTVSSLPIYLPYDKAPVPFGDPISDITVTSASPAVVTAPGYAPTVGDAIQFSASANSSGTAGVLPGGISVATTYYVITVPTGDTFTFSTAKGGSAVATTSSGAGLLTLHLVSNQVDGVTIPFKPGNNAVAVNQNAYSVTLMGASDLSASNLPYGPTGAPAFGQVQGPGTLNVITTLTAAGTAGAIQVVKLGYDWIQTSASGTVALLQN